MMLNANSIRHTIQDVIESTSDPMMITGMYLVCRSCYKLGLTVSQINQDNSMFYEVMWNMIDNDELVITPMNGKNFYSLGKMN